MQPDVIGTIYKTPPEYDDEGNVIKEGILSEGWHVNTTEPVPEWEQYRIPTPSTPTRVYQGGIMPVCYCFPDEATFRSLLPEEPTDV